MRSILFVVGLVFLGAALYLGKEAAFLIDALRSSGQFTMSVWKNWFWFRNPDDFTSGLAPNGRWLLEAFGAALLFSVGWSFMRTSMRMNE